VVKPEKAIRGFRPKVLNSRLNHTTSGLSRWMARMSLKTVAGWLNDQQRSTQ